MKQFEIMRNNKLIAEFMGVVFHDDENQYYNADGLHIGNTLQYHKSWDWLMPVVEKIESLRDANGNAYRFTIDMCNAQIEGTHIEILGGSHKIDTTYQAVVEFINQYNK